MVNHWLLHRNTIIWSAILVYNIIHIFQIIILFLYLIHDLNILGLLSLYIFIIYQIIIDFIIIFINLNASIDFDFDIFISCFLELINNLFYSARYSLILVPWIWFIFIIIYKNHFINLFWAFILSLVSLIFIIIYILR
jgi:hypothetical protein